MYDTIKCETAGTFDPKIQSRHIDKSGHREKSFGLSQINLPAHPEITRQQAIDPEFATTFMAKEFREGKQSMWSCWKINHSAYENKKTIAQVPRSGIPDKEGNDPVDVSLR